MGPSQFNLWCTQCALKVFHIFSSSKECLQWHCRTIIHEHCVNRLARKILHPSSRLLSSSSSSSSSSFNSRTLHSVKWNQIHRHRIYNTERGALFCRGTPDATRAVAGAARGWRTNQSSDGVDVLQLNSDLRLLLPVKKERLVLEYSC